MHYNVFLNYLHLKYKVYLGLLKNHNKEKCVHDNVRNICFRQMFLDLDQALDNSF